MRVFDLELSPSIIHEIAAHAERDFPVEACGVVLGARNAVELSRVVPLANVQGRYHARDPETFPRDGRDAFRVDELERIHMLERAEADGLVERVLYHSHCDAGAYFSPEDRAMAVQDGIELMPGVVHVVVSIHHGRRSDMAAYRYDEARRTFVEARIPLKGTDHALPDLELRAMEGRQTRPIGPCGGVLASRRISDEERMKLIPLLDRAHLRIDSAETIRDLRRFELGLLSPLTGFSRSVEARAIEQSGRLLSGTPWRTPVVLELSLKKDAVLPTQGSLVELVDDHGRGLAAMGLTEVIRGPKDMVRFAGPVYVYATEGSVSAVEMRAELIRRAAKRVLAVGSRFRNRFEKEVGSIDLKSFDAVLAPFTIPGRKGTDPLPLIDRDPWLDAVIAQNFGATHVWVDDPALARAIGDSLSIKPWRPDHPEPAQHPFDARDVRLLEADDE